MIELYHSTDNGKVVMGSNGATPLWIAEDGSWGTSPVTIFDAHYWTAKDFDQLDQASDSEKIAVAKSIADRTNSVKRIEERVFLDVVAKRSAELGIRMFQLTEDGMDELQ